MDTNPMHVHFSPNAASEMKQKSKMHNTKGLDHVRHKTVELRKPD